MTTTHVYSSVHRALLTTAKQLGLVPMNVRVVMAISDRGGAARSDELERDLMIEGSEVRRSVSRLREHGLVVATGGPGVRLTIMLTAKGEAMAQELEGHVFALQYGLVETGQAVA